MRTLVAFCLVAAVAMNAGSEPSTYRPPPHHRGQSTAAPAPTLAPIPVRAHVTTHYKLTQGDRSEECQLDAWADAQLTATIETNASWWGPVDPAHRASMFTIAPVTPLHGGGSMTATGQSKGGSFRAHADYVDAGFGVVLLTTGGDALFGGVEDGTSANSFGGHYRGSRTDTNASGSKTVALDERGSLCAFAIPFTDEATHPRGTPHPALGLSYGALVAAIQSGTTTTVAGTESFEFDAGRGGPKQHVVGTSTLELTLRPIALKVVVAPSDASAFEHWLPAIDLRESGNQALFGDPKPLELTVSLVDDQGKPPPAPCPKLVIDLQDVSEYPGMTMNYPARSAGNRNPDLFLRKEDEPTGVVVYNEKVARADAATSVKIKLFARDTAAYARVTAHCEGLAAAPGELRVPKDDNGNRIADAWENAEHVLAQSYPATWDEESVGNQPSNGDGYSLLDEYRGFLVTDGGGEAFARLSPQKKDLLVAPIGRDAALYRRGALQLAAAAGLAVHFVAENRLEAGVSFATTPRWANHEQTAFSTQQAAVRMEDKHVNKNPGTTFFVHAGQQMGSPNDVAWCNIDRENSEAFVHAVSNAMLVKPSADVAATAAKLHIRLEDVTFWVGAHREALVDEVIVFSAMHELGHAVNATHHGLGLPDSVADSVAFESGDKACPMRYWDHAKPPTDNLLFLSGRWDPGGATSASGAPWHLCESGDQDWQRVKLH